MAIFSSGVSNSSKMYRAGKASASVDGAPALFIGVTVQVGRQLSPIPTLTDGIVWSAQPVQGTFQAQSILTKNRALLEKMTGGNACTPMAIVLNLDDGECSPSGIKIDIADAFCSAVSFAASGAQGYVGNDFTCQFTKCTIG